VIASVAIAVFAVFVGWYRNGWMLSSDSRIYRGNSATFSPFHLRWLLPKVCGANVLAWTAVSYVAALASVQLVYVWTHSLVAAWLWAWLFVVQCAAARPALVDMASCALSLGAVVAWPVSPYLAFALVLLSGACKESGPVFAAAWSLNPFLLIGVIAAGWWIMPRRNDHPYCQRPWFWARVRHDPLACKRMLAPWGAVLILAPLGAGWDRATLAAMVSLALGYGQLLRSQDAARLYLWAAPAVLVLATRAQLSWLPVLLVAHPFLAIAEPRRVAELWRKRAEAAREMDA
jgi:hypothetical protein